MLLADAVFAFSQEHTDFEMFTILRQDQVGGLEVKNLSGKCQYIRLV